jgi:hypothetical protein
MLVLISGWKGSGKDTIAGYLRDNFGFKHLSFASPLKDEVARQYNLPREWMDSTKMKEEPLFHLPAAPKDAFGRNVAEFMFGELRTASGERPHGFSYQNDDFYVKIYTKEDGEFTKKGDEILVRGYWTPRALLILEGSMKRSVFANYWVSQAVAKTVGGGENYVISDARYKNEIETVKSTYKGDVVTIRVNRFASSSSNDPSERDLDDYQFDFTIDNAGTLEQLLEKIDHMFNQRDLEMISDSEKKSA